MAGLIIKQSLHVMEKKSILVIFFSVFYSDILVRYSSLCAKGGKVCLDFLGEG